MLVRDPVVPAFAQRIEEQRAALREIGGVMEPVGPQLLWTLDRVYALKKCALREMSIERSRVLLRSGMGCSWTMLHCNIVPV